MFSREIALSFCGILPTPKRITPHPAVTVSASFKRFMREMQLAVEELLDEGAQVLSPRRPLIPDREISGTFLLLKGDTRFDDVSVKSVQDRHLACVARSDFLWVVCPGGYIGNSAAMEIGAAIAANIPMYALHQPNPPRVAAYVTVVPSIKVAVLNHAIPSL